SRFLHSSGLCSQTGWCAVCDSAGRSWLNSRPAHGPMQLKSGRTSLSEYPSLKRWPEPLEARSAQVIENSGAHVLLRPPSSAPGTRPTETGGWSQRLTGDGVRVSPCKPAGTTRGPPAVAAEAEACNEPHPNWATSRHDPS